MTDRRTNERNGDQSERISQNFSLLVQRYLDEQRPSNGMGFTCLSLEGERLSSIQKERKKQKKKKERKRGCSLLDFTAGSKRRVKTREFYRRRLEEGRERERVSSRWSNEEKKFPQSEKELRGRKNILRVQSLRIRNEIVLRELFLEKGRIY